MLGEYNKNISIENFNVYDTSVLFQFIGDQTITPHLSKYEYNNIPKILISSKWYFDMDNDCSIPENSFFENNNICQNDTNPTNIVFSSSTQSKILCNGKMKIFSDFICNRDIVIGNSGEIGFYSCSI
ncbi:MAG: hypothetical protein NTU73_06960, partial [Ignavibacteriae bacterium]|nr:hypothetical protein [Ignavibacteriota bacterium]